MSEIKFQLMHSDEVLKERTTEGEAYLEFHHHYIPGDFYRVTVDEAPCYIVVQLDPAIKPAMIYLQEKVWDYQIPFNDHREWPYASSAFQTRNNYASVRYATEDEIKSRRNLAENSYDQHEKSTGYPHASANAETRGEYVFYCKNAIDGVIANSSHGNYPFESWGTNGQSDAEMTLDFGREVTVDTLAFILRADYPHDGYWTSVSLEYSDGSIDTLNLKKTSDRQIFKVDDRKVTWIKLFNLVEDTDPTTFSALTQFEAYGKNVIE